MTPQKSFFLVRSWIGCAGTRAVQDRAGHGDVCCTLTHQCGNRPITDRPMPSWIMNVASNMQFFFVLGNIGEMTLSKQRTNKLRMRGAS